MPSRRRGRIGCRRRDRLLFLDVEGDVLDAFFRKEMIDFPRGSQAFRREHGNGVKRDILTFQQSDAGHDLVEYAAAGAPEAIDVVNPSRPVDADSDMHSRGPEKIAPGLIEEGRVGLQALLDVHALRTMAFEDFGRAFVERNVEHGGLAGVPAQIELAAYHARGKQSPEQFSSVASEMADLSDNSPR